MVTKRKSKFVRESEVCVFCGSGNLVKRGVRNKKHESIQRILCRNCDQSFTGQTLRGKQFPTVMILESLSLYNQGFEFSQISLRLGQKFKTTVSRQTIARWQTEHQGLCPYSRLRAEAKKLFQPEETVADFLLEHQQPYLMRVHRSKVAIILKSVENWKFRNFLEQLEEAGGECPHALFREKSKSRASKSKGLVSRDRLVIERKTNFAVQAAKFVIQTVTRNTERHEAIQSFLLFNDSVTVCTELPVVLFQEDLDYFRNHGLQLDSDVRGTLTGHIDIIQIRRGRCHIIDYKPGAIRVDAFDQLLIYALAVSRMYEIPIQYISCGWFDHEIYFEFKPLDLFDHSKQTQTHLLGAG